MGKLADMIRSALLLLGGSGSRLGRLTNGSNKHLLPVYDRTLAQNSFEWLASAGIREILPIVRPDDAAMMAGVLERSIRPGVEIRIVEQPEPLGTADAILRGIRLLGQRDFIVLLGDNVFIGAPPESAFHRLDVDEDIRCFTHETSVDVDQFAIITRDTSGAQLHPKPHPYKGVTVDVVTGLFVINAVAFEQFEGDTARSWSGERDVLDFVGQAMKRGRGAVHRVPNEWFDAGATYESLWRAGTAVRAARTQTSGPQHSH